MAIAKNTHGRGVGDLRGDLRAAIDERRQVAAPEELLHHDRVLHGQRPVEAEVVPHLLERLRGRISARNACGRIVARRGEEDQEGEHGDREHHEQRPQQPADDESDHPGVTSRTASEGASPPA
jgi:hypothetical protein